MEAITAFVEGPLCFVILYGMLKQRSWRFTLQFAVSLGQLYGDVLYFATSYYDGKHSQPLWQCNMLSTLACSTLLAGLERTWWVHSRRYGAHLYIALPVGLQALLHVRLLLIP
jgi:hypothetical protein